MKMSLYYFLHYKYFGVWVFFFNFLLEGEQRSLRKERKSKHQGFYSSVLSSKGPIHLIMDIYITIYTTIGCSQCHSQIFSVITPQKDAHPHLKNTKNQHNGFIILERQFLSTSQQNSALKCSSAGAQISHLQDDQAPRKALLTHIYTPD